MRQTSIHYTPVMLQHPYLLPCKLMLANVNKLWIAETDLTESVFLNLLALTPCTHYISAYIS